MIKLNLIILIFLCSTTLYAKHNCRITDDGRIACFGDNEYGQTNVPCNIIKKPKQVVVGEYHSCALHKNGVTCWGSNYFGELNIPKLKDPIKLLMPYGYGSNSNSTCAFTKVGIIKCWGRLRPSQKSPALPPFLREITDIYTKKNSFICVNDRSKQGIEREVCWSACGEFSHFSIGSNTVRILKPTIEEFENIKSNYFHYSCDRYNNRCERTTYAGDFHRKFYCGTYKGILECWGNNYYGQAIVPNIIVNPEKFIMLDQSVYVLDDNKLHYWGYAPNYPSNLKEIIDVFYYKIGNITENKVCALNQKNESICWKDDFSHSWADGFRPLWRRNYLPK